MVSPIMTNKSPMSGPLSPARKHGRVFSCSLMSLVSHLFIAILSFNFGFLYSGHESVTTTPDLMHSVHAACPEQQQQESAAIQTQTRNRVVSTSYNKLLPTETVGAFVVGMGRIKRDDFTSMIDIGLPLDKTSYGNEEVLVLYSNAAALPRASPLQNDTASSAIPLYSAEGALQKCHSMRLIYQQPKKDRECVVMMGQWESYSIDKYMRIPKAIKAGIRSAGAVMEGLPFRHVARGQRNDGKVQKFPYQEQTKRYYKTLIDYLESMEATITRLEPIAKLAAGDGNAIIVMTCNWGQASLFANFVCAARSRGLDLSHVLLFSTDEETHALARSLGIHSFFVENSFGPMPKVAARVYGDARFAGMMMSKIYCVQLINKMGYDLLFQDVDLVWYKNPLDYFYSKEAGDYDMYFQDDGARSVRYAPFSPNSGFYFVRANEKTNFFFSVFLRMGDLVQASGSHQGALTSVLVEHSSWRGLSIKVFGMYQKEGEMFPGGYHFHRNKEYMRQLIRGEVEPVIFHMSWTKNKDNKKLFMQQLGHWYLNKQCEDKKVQVIGGPTNLGDTCCSAEPLVSCHYRDKPSKIPCKGSPPIDQGRPSFW